LTYERDSSKKRERREILIGQKKSMLVSMDLY
jgi:hypothetical protein